MSRACLAVSRECLGGSGACRGSPDRDAELDEGALGPVVRQQARRDEPKGEHAPHQPGWGRGGRSGPEAAEGQTRISARSRLDLGSISARSRLWLASTDEREGQPRLRDDAEEGTEPRHARREAYGEMCGER